MMNSIFIKENGYYDRIILSDILYIEGAGNYVKIYTTTKNYFVLFKLGYLESVLNSDNFLRVHKSYLVAKDKVTRFSKNKIFIDEIALPVGTTFTSLVMSSFNILDKANPANVFLV